MNYYYMPFNFIVEDKFSCNFIFAKFKDRRFYLKKQTKKPHIFNLVHSWRHTVLETEL